MNIISEYRTFDYMFHFVYVEHRAKYESFITIAAYSGLLL